MEDGMPKDSVDTAESTAHPGRNSEERLLRELAEGSLAHLEGQGWFDRADPRLWPAPEVAGLFAECTELRAYDQAHPSEGIDHVLYGVPMTPERKALKRRAQAAVRRATTYARRVLAERAAALAPAAPTGPQWEVALRIGERLRGIIPLAGVAVFGSVAKGTARPDSDIDLYLAWTHLPNSVRIVKGVLRDIRTALGAEVPVEASPRSRGTWRWRGYDLHIVQGTSAPVGRGFDGVHRWIWHLDAELAFKEHARLPTAVAGRVGPADVVATVPPCHAPGTDPRAAVSGVVEMRASTSGRVRVLGFDCVPVEGKAHVGGIVGLDKADVEAGFERDLRRWLSNRITASWFG